MPLNKPALKSALVDAFTEELPSVSADQAAAIDRIATKFSDAIDAFVRSGTVPSGIPVTVLTSTGIGATTGVGSIE
jgi:hypothetical protein